MLHLLRCPDQGDIAHGRVSDVFNCVRRSRSKAVDDFTGFRRLVSLVTSQKTLDFANMPFCFLQMIAESLSQFRVAGVFDEVGERFRDFLLHVQGLFQIAYIKGSQIFNVR